MSSPNAHALALWSRRARALRALLRWLRGEDGAAEALAAVPRLELIEAAEDALRTAERLRGQQA